MPEELRFKFMRYFSNIITIIHYNFGSDWDSAELLDYNLNNKRATNFVLSGRFLECCQKRAILDDKTMCYINKDIHNRIYTLLVNEYFN